MSADKHCPLCGKQINESEDFCEECYDHMEHQYATDFLDVDNRVAAMSSKEDTEIEEETEDDGFEKDEERPLIEPKRKKGLSKGVIFVLVGCVVLVAVGLIGSVKLMQQRQSEENEIKFWNNCVEENTPLSYSKYLVTYQNGKFEDEANKRIRAIRKAEADIWEKLKKSSDINAFYTYISENPKTPYMSQIRDIMDSLSWLSTTKDNTVDAYKAYLENVKLENISGQHVEEAKERYTYWSSISVLDGAALASLKLDLLDFYKKLSQNNPKDLLKEFAPSVYYYTNEISATDIVAQITKERRENKVKKIIYTPVEESIYAKTDRHGIVFVELTVKTETSFNIRKKQDELHTSNLLMELDSIKQVRSIKLKK